MRSLVRGMAGRLRSARRKAYLTSHPRVRGNPAVELVVVPAVAQPGHLASAERLLRAYQRAQTDYATAAIRPRNDDLWTNLLRTNMRPLLQILDGDDPAALAAYLLHFGEQYTWFGGLTFSFDGYLGSADRSLVAFTYLDRLICLAEALGVLPMEHPEHGRWGENLYGDVSDIVRRIEAVLGISIAPPPAMHVVGIRTPVGALHYRHLNAIYVAARLKQLLSRGPGGAICEYGGGLGVVALYSRRLGIADYTLYDIPLTNVFAGYFLIASLGDDAVSLYGEPARRENVKVLPFWTCVDARDDAFRIAMNQDSFPEIDADLVDRYLREIARTTEAFFLSINHEAESAMTAERRQLNVSAMLRDRPGFVRLSRSKYWLREGYVEELYEISG
jgi:hypothetical protein